MPKDHKQKTITDREFESVPDCRDRIRTTSIRNKVALLYSCQPKAPPPVSVRSPSLS